MLCRYEEANHAQLGSLAAVDLCGQFTSGGVLAAVIWYLMQWSSCMPGGASR